MRCPRAWGLLVSLLLTPLLAGPDARSYAQSVSIPSSAKTAASARNTGQPRITGPHKPSAKPVMCTHTVRRGEAISRIAVRYRVTRQSLIEANRLENPAALHKAVLMLD